MSAVDVDDGAASARAIEVAAMLGDSIVGVKYCIDPKAGRVQRATWALLAAGAAGLVAFGIAFCSALETVAANEATYAYETTVLHKPGLSVRPDQVPISHDWIAFGGLLASIVTCAAALLRLHREGRSSSVRIGSAPRVDFPNEQSPSPDFALVAPQGDHWAFHFADGMEGEIVVGDTATALAELARQGRRTISPIPAGAAIRVQVGMTTLLVASVMRPRRLAVPMVAFDGSFTKSLAGTTVAFGILLLVASQIPIADSGAGIELAAFEDSATRSKTTEHDDVPPPPSEHAGDEDDEEIGGTGTSMTFDTGTMGNADSRRAEGQYRMKKELPHAQLARAQIIEQARAAGILGSSAIATGGAFASLTGTGDISSGFEDANVYGGKLGNEAGEMNGGFGYGRSGFGPGGGGTGWGTICAGRYGTIGHGSGTGSGYGVGGGRCGGCNGRRRAAIPTVSIGQPYADGDLDKATIRRYIKRNVSKLAFCYEKQLLAKPELSGTVWAQFFITPSGSVASSTATGVDAEVANCVADVIGDIEFPKAKNGGGVQVTYPFTFQPAGR